MKSKRSYDPNAPRKRKDWFYKTLEYLAQNAVPVNVSGLARDLKCSQPIIYRIIASLEKEWSAVKKHEDSDFYKLTLEGIFLLCYEESKRLEEKDEGIHNQNFEEYVSQWEEYWDHPLLNEKMEPLGIPELEVEKAFYIERLFEFEQSKNELPLEQKLEIGAEMLRRKNSVPVSLAKSFFPDYQELQLPKTMDDLKRKYYEVAQNQQESHKETQTLSNNEIMEIIRQNHKNTTQILQNMEQLMKMRGIKKYPKLEP